jgi:hypothetical protein
MKKNKYLLILFIMLITSVLRAQYNDYIFEYYSSGYRNDEIIYDKKMDWAISTDTIMKSYPLCWICNPAQKTYLKKHQTSKPAFIIGELDLDCLF